jgi:hypothetical protein
MKTKTQKIIDNIQNDSNLNKKLTEREYNDIEGFVADANRYIRAIKECRMVCTIPSVSSSGMSRVIKFVEVSKGDKRHYVLNFYGFMKNLGFTPSKNNDGFRISGCGMDMVFHTNYTIIHRLGKLGFLNKKEVAKLAQMTPVVI